jgi:tetratricopeptide (TPR) repeat protein
MPLATLLRLILALLCLLAGAPLQANDNAAQLPDWADNLRAVTEIDLKDQDPKVRDAITNARKRLNTALQDRADPADLASAYGELGALYHVHAVFQPADDCYENAKLLDPDNFRWAYYSAVLAARTGRTRLALARFENARRLRPGYQALTVRMADVWLDLNEQDKARAAYESVVSTTGLEAASLYGLGQIALLNRNFDSAIDYFNRALEKDPDATRIHYPLAQALRAVKRDAEARQHIALRGDTPPTIKDPQVESLQAMKRGAAIHFIHAMNAINRHDYHAAKEAFAQGLAKEPDNAIARTSYARTLYLTDRKSEVRPELDRALATQPDNTLGLFLLGVLIEEAGDPATAADYYRRVLQHNPAHAGAHFYLANQHYRQQQYARAASHYARSIQAEPNNMAAYLPYLGTQLHSGASDPEIMEHLQAALRQFPENTAFSAWQVRFLATSDAAQAGNPVQALARAQQLVEQQPIPPHQEVLALAWACNGNFEKAVSVQEELVSLAIWSAPPGESQRLTRILTAYQDGKLPARTDVMSLQILQPPLFNGVGPFRDYPAPRPY